MATRKLLGSAAIVAAVAGGGLAGAIIGTPLVTSAQEADDGTTTTAPDDGSTTPGPADDGFRGGRGHFGHFGHFGHVDLEVAADVLGMSVDDLRTALSDGKTLADIAGEQGVEVQALIDALVADAQTDLVERVTAAVNGEMPLGRPGGPGGHGHGRFGHVDLDVAAEELGLSVEDLRTALADGKTLADIAGDQGVEVQELIDALVADATADIDEKVTEGDITEEQATEMKANLAERVTAAVNGELPARGPGGPGGHGPGGRGRGPAPDDSADSESDSGSATDSGTSFDF